MVSEIDLAHSARSEEFLQLILTQPPGFEGFGYLDDEGNAAFLRALSAALKPGARFVLETPMVLENLLRQLQDRPWWKVGDVYLLVANEYDHTRVASTSNTRSFRTAALKCATVRIGRTDTRNCVN
jgi:hypothetical protein